MLLKKTPEDPQTKFYISKCKYCGRIFIKFENKTCYCRDACRTWAKKEQKAAYQQKRRKLIKEGVLISNENNRLGTTFLSEHRNPDFNVERNNLRNEAERIGLTL